MTLKKCLEKFKFVTQKIKRVQKRYVLPFTAGVSLILILVLIISLKNSRKAEAIWWPGGDQWTKRQLIPIKNNSSESLASGTTVAVTINTKSLFDLEKLQSDCDDVRVVYQSGSSYTVLNRYITYPSGGACSTSETTKVYFPLQDTLSSGSTSDNYYVYYGNPTAAAFDNPDNAFDIGNKQALLVCPFNGTTTCAAGETPSTSTGSIRFEGSKSALSFDGYNTATLADVDLVTSSASGLKNLFQQDMTAEMWVFQEDRGEISSSTLMATRNNGVGWELQVNWGQLNLRVDCANQDALFIAHRDYSVIPYSQWTHVAITWDKDNGTAKFFINGSEVTYFRTDACVGSAVDDSANSFYMGKSLSGTTSTYAGIIDEARISNVIRYTQNFTPQTNPFISDSLTKLLYHFDESGQDPRNSGTYTAFDDSGLGHHGTIQGAKYVSGLVGVNNSESATGEAYSQSLSEHSGVFSEEATVNKITNPSFEHSTFNTSWSTTSGATLIQNTLPKYIKFGSKSAVFHSANTYALSDNLGSTYTDGIYNQVSTNRLAQGFQVTTNISPDYVSAQLNRQGTVTSRYVNFTIETDDTGYPSGTAVNNGTTNCVQGSTLRGESMSKFTFPTPPSLTSSTQYHLVLRIYTDSSCSTEQSSVDASNYITWYYDNTSTTYSNGTREKLESGIWTSYASTDYNFYLGKDNHQLTTSINAGNTNTHTLTAYVYNNNLGLQGALINATYAQLVFNGAAQTTTYTDMGGGWTRLSYTGAAGSGAQNYGIQVKAGYLLYVDGFQLEEKSLATSYTDGTLTSDLGGSNTYFWDDDCDGVLDAGEDDEPHTKCSSRIKADIRYSGSDNVNSSGGSISIWFKNDGTIQSREREILQVRGANFNMIRIVSRTMNNGDLSFMIYPNDPTAYVAAFTNTGFDNKWHHALLTWSNNGQIIGYRDGVATSPVTLVGAPTGLESGNIYIGEVYGAQYQTNGTLSDLRVYDTPLTSAEAVDLYYAGLVSRSDIFEVDQFNSSKGQDPIAVYHLDEGYGSTAHDSSPYGHHLTVSGASWVAANQYERTNLRGSISFDGTNDYAYIESLSAKNLNVRESPFSITAWVRHSHNVSGTDTILSKYNSAGYQLYMNSSGQICFGIDDDSSWGPDDAACSASSYADSSWHNISAVKTSSSIKLYIDGHLAASDTSLSATGSLSNNAIFTLGSASDFSGNWDGYLDEVYIYPYEKSIEQIKSSLLGLQGSTLFGARLSNTTTGGLVSHWPLDNSLADSSGNAYSLTNNGSTTFSNGKFNLGSEHVNSSNQYLSLSIGSTTTTYYFDGSDASPTDPQSVWSDDSNGFDGSTSTSAGTSTFGTSTNNYLMAEGTNAPSSGGAISLVRARMYTDVQCSPTDCSFGGQIRTNSWSESLATILGGYNSSGWSGYTTLTAPSGGWTWEAIQSLETRIYLIDNPGNSPDWASFYRIEIEVTSSAGNTPSVGSAAFWVNPDSTTNYYLSLNSSLNITSSGTLTASGFNNPKIYINGIESTSITDDTWQHVVVTFDPVSVNQVYIGRTGSNYFDGTLDEIRLYNRVLSDSEVYTLYKWAPGPVGWWKLDDNNGNTATDSSGNGNSGTLTSMPSAPWITGRVGTALQFDGTDDRVDLGSPTTLDNLPAMTLSYWMYPMCTNEYESPVAKADYGGAGLGWLTSLYCGDNRITFTVGYDSQNLTRTMAGQSITRNSWQYVTITYDGGSSYTGVHIYIDGKEVTYHATQGGTDGSGTKSSDAGQTLYIGNVSGFAEDFTGYLDDVKIYNYVRTPAQITEDMNIGHPAPGSPIGSTSAWYKFDEGYDTTAHDSSPNKYDGTVTNATWNNSGKYEKALSFSGSNQYVSLPNNILDSFSQGTVCSWVYFGASTDLGANYTILGYGDTASSAYKGLVEVSDESSNSAKIRSLIIINDTSNQLSFETDNEAVERNSWSHVCVTQDGSNPKIYVNGTDKTSNVSALGSATQGTWFSAIAAQAENADIGRVEDSTPGDYFLGTLDELKVYNFALTSDQVKVEYNQGATTVWGSTSTNPSNGNKDNSASSSYCVPGDTQSCNPPVAHWTFDENNGSYIYSNAGTLLQGTFSGTPSWAPGKKGSGLSFGGSGYDDTVEVQPNSVINNLSTMTVEAWIFPRSLGEGGLGRIFQKANTTLNGRGLYLSSNNSLTYYHGWSGSTNSYAWWQTANNTITLNQWNHVAVSYNDSSTSNVPIIYINGISVPVTTVQAPSGTKGDDSAGAITIGNRFVDGVGLDRTFDGIIDDLIFYNYIRSGAQIAWDYNQGAPIVLLRMDECSGNTLYDTSSHGYNSTLSIGSGGSNTTAGTCGSGISTQAWNNGTDGKMEYSMDFDGTDDFASTTTTINLTRSNKITVAFWLNWDSYSGNDDLALESSVDSNTNDGAISINPNSSYANLNRMQFVIQDSQGSGAYRAESIVRPSAGEWHHYVAIFDNSTTNGDIRIFVDGIERQTNMDWDNKGQAGTFGNYTWYFMSRAGTSLFGAGKMDDFRLYNYPLTEVQIKTIFNDDAAIRFTE